PYVSSGLSLYGPRALTIGSILSLMTQGTAWSALNAERCGASVPFAMASLTARSVFPCLVRTKGAETPPSPVRKPVHGGGGFSLTTKTGSRRATCSVSAAARRLSTRIVDGVPSSWCSQVMTSGSACSGAVQEPAAAMDYFRRRPRPGSITPALLARLLARL